MLLDLHRHLEGSHSPRALLEVARQFDIRHDNFFDAAANRFRTEAELSTRLVMAAPSDDANVFYGCIVKARAAYVSVEAIRALSLLAFREAADDTDGFEMRLSLFSMTRTLLENTRGAWRDVAPVEFAEKFARPILLAVISACDEVKRETGKPMVLRLGLSRTFESAPHYDALADMVREHARSLIGLDVLGIVTGVDTEPLPAGLLGVLDKLRRVLPDLTIHAGEFAGHESVDRTLALSPRGIGHGVHSLQSPKTLERLAKEGVTLEVCPSSNRLLIPTALEKLGVDMPLKHLQHAHVHAVLGSDDPTPMGTSFRREVEVAREGGVDMVRLEADIMRRWAEMTR
ncbi:MAG: hypothetical protein DI536_35165 [Archangium gephyra]|uniref:adenosine deaminase n=1 Tax=Archangium gephyra TaxID=48 RepID=A0A2W5SSV9_9BACT|nr:MAG: hypothetical protein DI536_35165 [Archangium gephyra]